MIKAKKILVMLTLLAFTAGSVVPEALAITVREEEKIAKEFIKAVSKHYRIIKDPLIAGYVDRIGQHIVSRFPPQPFTYHFYVIDEDVYNAFAGPGAHVFIHRGLMEAMDSEDELAGILGHEITHVHCRHISEMIDRSKKVGMATMAGILAGLFLGVGGSVEAASAVTLGTVAAGQSIELAYSRNNEMQADQIGLKYLAEAGYSADGLLDMLKKIRSKQWFGSEQIPGYLMTHPAVEDRIVYIQGWVADNPVDTRSARPKTANEFQKVKARLSGMYGSRDITLKRFEEQLKADPDNAMAHYGYGLVLARSGRRAEAAEHFQAALIFDAGDPYVLEDLGILYFHNGQYQKALSTLKGAVSVLPDDQKAQLFIGRSLLGLGRLNEAVSVFETIIGCRPDYNEACYYLGEGYGKQGRLGEAHYYLGLYYFNEHDFKNATFHLKRAFRKLHDPDKKQEVREKLQKIKRSKTKKKQADAKQRLHYFPLLSK